MKKKKKEDMKILMVGLDASGKTTILYKLKLGDIVTTIPTIGWMLDDGGYQWKSINQSSSKALASGRSSATKPRTKALVVLKFNTF